jgi:protein NrfD
MANTTATARPSRRPAFTWRNTDIFWVIGLLALAIGASGMWQRMVNGLAPTNLGSYVPWGLWVGFYDYLVWLEVGSLLLFTILFYIVKVKELAPIKPVVMFTGFVVLLMALIIVFVDLGQATRFWHVLVYPTFSSMITWMVWLHSLYLLVLAAELVLVFNYLKLAPARKEQILHFLAYLSLPMGLGLILVSGSVFGVVAARPLWSTSSLPLMFLVSSLAAGSGLILLLIVLFWPDKNSPTYGQMVTRLSGLTRWLLIAGVFSASVIGFTTLFGGGSPTRVEAMNLILTGPFWWSFWIIHVLLGVLVPLALLFLVGDKPLWAGIAAFLSVVTFVAVTLNVVIPVLATPELQGLADVYNHSKLSYNYVPNWMEWQVIIFVFGFGSLLYGLGWRWLPLKSE